MEDYKKKYIKYKLKYLKLKKAIDTNTNSSNSEIVLETITERNNDFNENINVYDI
jgi:hypothetical protein